METEIINGMLTVKLNMLQTVALGVIAYYFGVFVRRKIHIFSRLSIPASAIGGLTTALIVAILQYRNIVSFTLDLTLQNMLMIMFFSTVGMNASYKLLKKGSTLILSFWLVCALAVVLQNIVGIGVAKLFNMNPLMGIVCGSMSMIGGLGTSGTFGSFFESSLGVTNATVAGIACATFGMVVGSAIGGPLAEWIIKKCAIQTPHSQFLKKYENDDNEQSSDYEEIGVIAQEEGVVPLDEKEDDVVSGPHLMQNLTWVLIAIGIGSAISFYFNKANILLPSYLVAMIVAVLIRNLGDFTKFFEIDTKAIGMISDISLSVFVTMVISSLNLWQLSSLAMPVLVMLLVQTALVVVIAYFLVFLLLGKDYESTVMASGFAGFGLGATPNALANMQAVSLKNGLAQKAFFVVPIVSAFLIDFTNAILIMFFAKIFK